VSQEVLDVPQVGILSFPIPGVRPAPLLNVSHIVRIAKVIPVFRFSQPAPLADAFAGLLAFGFTAKTLVVGVPIIGKEFLAAMTAGPVEWGVHGELHP
jgi:hypothetical protein